LPHSEIHGSKLIRSSPWLIAAYHVLHRLCMPRHPPDALISLDHSHRQCSPFWRPLRGTRREVTWSTSSHSRTRCEPRSFEHRKRKGCAILLASCSGALCQSHLEKGLAKDQLLETEPDATRSGMAIETGEPIPTVQPDHSLRGDLPRQSG
jgi:hypothetical protein